MQKKTKYECALCKKKTSTYVPSTTGYYQFCSRRCLKRWYKQLKREYNG